MLLLTFLKCNKGDAEDEYTNECDCDNKNDIYVVDSGHETTQPKENV